MYKIKSKEISIDNFESYGMVVKASVNEPTSQSSNYKFWSDMAHYLIEGETEIGLCTVYKQPDNRITGLERHLRTPEILIPIDAPFVLPLLVDGQKSEQAVSFLVNVGEAVVINKGIWHGASIPVGVESSSYFVIFRRKTPHEDVEMMDVEPFLVKI